MNRNTARRLFALGLFLACAAAHSATVLGPITERGVQPMRGTTNVGSPLDDDDACWSALAADAEARRASTPTARCVTTRSRPITYTAPPPAPAPAPTPAPAPGVWNYAAGEGGRFSVAAATTVRFGLSGRWAEGALAAGTHTCGSALVGGRDPAPGVGKVCEVGGAAAPAPIPAPSPAPAPAPGVVTLHFADCQAGAASTCIAGSNANSGAADAPKRDLAGVDIGALPAGARLLFNRGGAWSIARLGVENGNATRTAPIVFDAYGSGPAPLWRVASGVGVQLGGGWGNTNNDGGYTFRNLRVQGLNGGSSSDGSHWGFWLVQNVRDVTIENVEITGFKIAIHASAGSPYGVSGLNVRNSVISRNSDMGHLGALTNSSYENNLFEGNNFSGSMMSHAIYLGGGNGNVIRNNRFVGNSAVNGQCTGGNFTAHGQIDGLLIEGNTIDAGTAAAAPTCGGINITQGYTEIEAFRNVVIRGNTGVNLGQCLVCANSAPGIVIEGNRSIKASTELPTTTLANAFMPSDTPMTDPVVRNNVVCGAGSVTNMVGTVEGNRTLPLTDPACAR